MRLAPDPNVTVSQISYSFEDGSLDVVVDAGTAVEWLTDPEARTRDALRPIVEEHLPSRMREGGYDPFADPDLEGAIRRLAEGLTAGGALPETTGANLSASLALEEEVTRGIGDVEVTLPAGTAVTLRARLAGGLPESPSAIEVAAVELDFGGSPGEYVHLNLAGSGPARDFPLVYLSGATLHSGGGVTRDYRLATEVVEGGIDAPRALTGGPASRARGMRDLREGKRHPELRERVSQVVDERVEPMVRDVVLRNRDAFPAVDLAEALDVSG